MEDLEERFFLSTSAFLNKIKKLKQCVDRISAGIRREKNQLLIKGNEYQIRRLIHDLIMREIGLTYDGLEIASNYFKNINTVEVQALILFSYSQT